MHAQDCSRRLVLSLDNKTNVPVEVVVKNPEVKVGKDQGTPWWRYAVVAVVFYILGWLLS